MRPPQLQELSPCEGYTPRGLTAAKERCLSVSSNEKGQDWSNPALVCFLISEALFRLDRAGGIILPGELYARGFQLVLHFGDVTRFHINGW